MSNNARAAAHSSLATTSRHIGRVILLVILALALMVGTAVATAWTSLQGNIDQADISGLLGDDRPNDEETAPADGFAGRALNILVLGSDVRSGDSDVDGAGASGEISGMRADTTMLFHIGADRSHVEVVSIPRDTLVDIPSCTVWDENGNEISTTRATYDSMFNAAFAYGGQGGSVATAAACSMKTVEQLTGIRLDGYVVVNFAAFQQIVDALGGVPMYFDEDMTDENSGLNVAAGCRLLGGQQALALARARYQLGDGSDISRIGRQQELVTAMVQEILNLNLLTNLPKMYQVLDAGTQSLSTSQGLGDITTLVGLANSLRAIDTSKIHFITMPFVYEGARVRPLESEAAVLWNALINDHKVTAETDQWNNVSITDLTLAEQEAAASASQAPAATTPGDASAPTAPADNPVMAEPAQTPAASSDSATVEPTTTAPICTKENAQ
ncbi:LCP family protein [Arcanobacterium haemolyticum]|nr:LCP family protein [Arcanobacterium haemolyticum]